jgi:hypothetical protein
MFELKNVKAMEGHSGYTGVIYYKGQKVCGVHTWGFSSCGVLNLQGFGYPEIKEIDTFAKEFFLFLRTVHDPHWKPCEAYFCLSDGQLTHPWIKALCKHPEVKRRDRFYNKSHGPNHMNLFRWSKAKDFKRVVKYG